MKYQFHCNRLGTRTSKNGTMQRTLKDRCDFISTSHMSIDIQPSDEYGSFDGYKGWKGMVAYVTKNMYNVDNIVENIRQQEFLCIRQF